MFVPDMCDKRVVQTTHCLVKIFLFEELFVLRPLNGIAEEKETWNAY